MLWWTRRKLKGSPNTRLEAIAALGRSGNRRALEPLQAILEGKDRWAHKTSNAEEERAAIEALADLGDALAIPALVRALKNPMLIGLAVAALGRLGQRPTTELAALLVSDDVNLALKRDVANQLTKLGWNPSTSMEKAWFYVVGNDYESAVSECGPNALEPLFKVLLGGQFQHFQQITDAILRIDKSSSVRKKLIDIAREEVTKADGALSWDRLSKSGGDLLDRIDRAFDTYGVVIKQMLEFIARENPEAILADLFARVSASFPTTGLGHYNGKLGKFSVNLCELIFKVWSDQPTLRQRITELTVRTLPAILNAEHPALLFGSFEDVGENTGNIYFRGFKTYSILSGTLLHLHQRIGAPVADMLEGLGEAFSEVFIDWRQYQAFANTVLALASLKLSKTDAARFSTVLQSIIEDPRFSRLDIRARNAVCAAIVNRSDCSSLAPLARVSCGEHAGSAWEVQYFYAGIRGALPKCLSCLSVEDLLLLQSLPKLYGVDGDICCHADPWDIKAAAEAEVAKRKMSPI